MVNNGNKSYKVEIGFTPTRIGFYISEPFFWILYSRTDKEWFVENMGWARTQEEAFKEAHEFFKAFKDK